MAEAVAELVEATKVYRRGALLQTAVAGVSMTVQPGDFDVVMGRSGSGKSTLLALLGTLATPTDGLVRLFGQTVTALDDQATSALRAQRLGFVFQFTGLLPTLTAFDNVRLPTLFGPPADRETNRRARNLLRRVGLGDRLGAYPSELSGGEQRRVAIARALLAKPALLLADEPTGDLDDETEREILDLLSELHREGLTIVLVTHNVELVAHATRTFRMRNGHLTEEPL